MSERKGLFDSLTAFARSESFDSAEKTLGRSPPKADDDHERGAEGAESNGGHPAKKFTPAGRARFWLGGASS